MKAAGRNNCFSPCQATGLRPLRVRLGSTPDPVLCCCMYLAAMLAAEELLRTAVCGAAGGAGDRGLDRGVPCTASSFLLTKRSSDPALEGRQEPPCASKSGLLPARVGLSAVALGCKCSGQPGAA